MDAGALIDSYLRGYAKEVGIKLRITNLWVKTRDMLSGTITGRNM